MLHTGPLRLWRKQESRDSNLESSNKLCTWLQKSRAAVVIIKHCITVPTKSNSYRYADDGDDDGTKLQVPLKKNVQFHQFLRNDIYVGEAEGGLLSRFLSVSHGEKQHEVGSVGEFEMQNKIRKCKKKCITAKMWDGSLADSQYRSCVPHHPSQTYFALNFVVTW